MSRNAEALNILGLSICSGHDSSAAVIKGGKLIAAVEEERLNRIKHFSGFPALSIKFCLKEAGLVPEDIHYVGIPWHPYVHLLDRMKFVFFNSPSNFFRRLKFVLLEIRNSFVEAGKVKAAFPKAEVVFIEHHVGHAASAFYASPFEEAAVFTADGRGEWATALLGVGKKNELKKLKEAFYPNSLGLLYLALTHYLGFEENDEYKVMGMSSYGKPVYEDFFKNGMKFSEKSIFQVNLDLLRHPGFTPGTWGEDYFSEKVVAAFGAPRAEKEPMNEKHMDIAASLQKGLNDVGVEIANHLYELTKQENLCLAGGVALNGVMNYKIKAGAPFKNIYIQPASGDGGLSAGTAFYIYHHILGGPRKPCFEHAYWGPQYSDDDVKRELQISMLEYAELKDPSFVAARLLEKGCILGWFQGRSEYGPRALGNRSILADPRKAENKDMVNARIKFREEFRPFAPSILEECVDEFYENCGVSPYMLLVCPVKDGSEKIIPSVTHVDKTGRVQTVNNKTNPRYYALIKHFYELTGVPVILNTSFNVKGEPIVNSPADAIRCFFTTGLDFLIVERFMLFKKPLNKEVLEIIEMDKQKQAG